MGAKLVVVLGHTSCGALLAEGNSMKQAAAALGIGTRTVAFHEYQAMEALSVRSSAQLVRFAVESRLLAAGGS